MMPGNDATASNGQAALQAARLGEFLPSDGRVVSHPPHSRTPSRTPSQAPSRDPGHWSSYAAMRERDLLSPIFQSTMVLQRAPKQARVWGMAKPGQQVRVYLGGDVDLGPLVATVVADTFGAWLAVLPPQKERKSVRLTVFTDDSNKTITDIAFGDVFLCAGQSNMKWPLNWTFNATRVAEFESSYDIRVMGTSNTWPPNAQSLATKSWQALRKTNLTTALAFSAICGRFGAEISAALGSEVAVGLLDVSLSGTLLEQWSSHDMLLKCGHLWHMPESLAKCENVVTRPPSLADGPWCGGLWKSMMTPLLPMALKGVVLWIGEANSRYCAEGHDLSKTCQAPFGGMFYSCQLEAMINGWRNGFQKTSRNTDLGSGEDVPLPFVMATLSSVTSVDHTMIRHSQTQVARRMEGVFVAQTWDLGHLNAPGSGPDLALDHSPRMKAEQARRLAAIALLRIYDQTSMRSEGPILRRIANLGVQVNLEFSSMGRLNLHGTAGCIAPHAETLDLHELSAQDAAHPEVPGGAPQHVPVQRVGYRCCDVSPFFWRTTDNRFVRHPANATDIVDDIIVKLKVPSGLQVTSLQYAWEAYPNCGLYDGEGGPRPGKWDGSDETGCVDYEQCIYEGTTLPATQFWVKIPALHAGEFEMVEFIDPLTDSDYL